MPIHHTDQPFGVDRHAQPPGVSCSGSGMHLPLGSQMFGATQSSTLVHAAAHAPLALHLYGVQSLVEPSGLCSV